MLLRPAEDRDAEAMAELFLAADDTNVLSAAGVLHIRRTVPERARQIELVAEDGGAVVALGAAGLNTVTTAEGAAWAFVTVAPAHRGRGIGDRIGNRLLDHLREIGATKASSFFRWTEEGERWALARGWSRELTALLIALDPREVPEPALPPGYRCAAMAELAPEAVYEAFKSAVVDEPAPVPMDDVRLDEFLDEWSFPDRDLEASSVVVAEDGAVVTYAFLSVAGDRARHDGTGTVGEHRGRGLATAAKRRSLREAAARGVTVVTTSNAEENAAMLAINRKLGFEPIGEQVIFGRDL